MHPICEIIIVGDEILSGRTLDSNARHMTAGLSGAGFSVRYMTVVGDRTDDIRTALATAAGRSDIVLVTGGLGPTSDDRTLSAAAEAFGRVLVMDEDEMERIRGIFARRGRRMSDANAKQAFIPEGSEALPNEHGTAPGVHMRVPGGGDGTCDCYFMPGVPAEMEAMFGETVLPAIQVVWEPERVDTATVRITGITESGLYDRIGDIPGAREAFSYYPGPSGIQVNIRVGAGSSPSAAELRDEVVNRLGDLVYSTDGGMIGEVVGGLLASRSLTIAVAESCTGGLVGSLLTDVPGSSAYFMGGVVAYDNAVKETLLGVDGVLIGRHGAVSSEVAAAMASGVRARLGTDIGISTTGIAGPGGATPSKPVGLVHVGIADADGVSTKSLQFVEDRIINKHRMAVAALNMVRLYCAKLK